MVAGRFAAAGLRPAAQVRAGTDCERNGSDASDYGRIAKVTSELPIGGEVNSSPRAE